MIDPHDKNIQWQDMAHGEMPFSTMIDFYYDRKLIEKWTETPRPFYPYPIGELYNGLYLEHKKLLDKVIKIMTGQLVFTPSNINKVGTNEHYLFIAINEIFNIVWFYNIDKTQKGYEKAKKKYNDAFRLVQKYSDKNIPDQFPSHKNEIIKEFEEFFSHIHRVQQGDKVISAIREHFGIVTATATKQQKISKGIDGIFNLLEENGYKYSDETSKYTLKK